MFLTSDPSVSWSADWWSTVWREAAGNLAIELIVSVFSPNSDGSFTNLENTIVGSSQSLFNETDYNADDTNNGAGNTDSGTFNNTLGTTVPVAAGTGCWCWVQLVGFATANETAQIGQSHMALFAQAIVPTIGIFLS
jgi:hypothetical protein